jgi:hypothetical protein
MQDGRAVTRETDGRVQREEWLLEDEVNRHREAIRQKEQHSDHVLVRETAQTGVGCRIQVVQLLARKRKTREKRAHTQKERDTST